MRARARGTPHVCVPLLTRVRALGRRIHKNNIKEIKDDYFAPTPALERVSLWGQGAKLTNLPSSLVNCKALNVHTTLCEALDQAMLYDKSTW